MSQTNQNTAKADAGQNSVPTFDVSKICLNLSITFFPCQKTGDEIQDAAESSGARLIGGSSEMGALYYEASGYQIGEFRRLVESLGLQANII